VSALLPAPRLPLATDQGKPRADTLAAVAGEDLAAPLRDCDRLQAEALAALEDLTEHRPGGRYWAEALAEDKTTANGGTTPKTYATERLLARDAHRWAHASALCRALTDRQRAARQALDFSAIASASWAAMDAAELKWTEAVVAAWQARESKVSAGRQSVAYEATLPPLKDWATAGQLWRWARGQKKPSQPERVALEALRHGFPGGPVGRRWWQMKHDQTGGQPLTIPSHITEAETEVRLTRAGRDQHARTVVGAAS
jgi:hypothetical protein